ncbi:hypothetical protein [Natrialba swarupiae]|uniref:Uncharacterized protein n=1 Tax=Natrialba swarupiae TaxID=2448032 RepID=A0A5D5AKI7_9EURY|nr:hypothetical protein [Natrialba swarupiae]TYT61694.1 hypothetical protein FYC77_12570 [Natrialba swarupiae]
MHRDYRYTVYVLALTALVTLATVGLAAAGSANTSVPADASLSNADIEVVDHDDALDDEETDDLLELVRDIEALQEHFDGVDALQADVYQAQALDDGKFVAIEDEYDVRLAPSDDDRLPRASLSIDLGERALVIDDTVAPLGDVTTTVEDDGLLTDEEAEQLTETLLDDDDIAYNVQTQLDEPESVEVAVTDRDGDEVGAELTAGENGTTIFATVALEEETVRSHHVEMEFEIDDDNAADSDEEAFAIEIKNGDDDGEHSDEGDETQMTAEEVESVDFDVIERDDDFGGNGEFYIEITDDEENTD